jgi:hypothetical protein
MARRWYYHGTKPEYRESILQNGIDYRQHHLLLLGAIQKKRKDTSEVSYAPRGNYLAETPGDCMYYSGYGCDTWKVDTKGLKLYSDAAWYKGWCCRARIEPWRITMIQKG